MKQQLEIGTLASGAKFTLPLDIVAHTLAIIGMRGSGKTVAATVLAEGQLQALFGDLEKATANGVAHTDASVWEPWKEKLGKGPANIIDLLLQRSELTKQQIVTLTSYSESNVRNNLLPALRRNGLLEQEGGKYRLRQP